MARVYRQYGSEVDLGPESHRAVVKPPREVSRTAPSLKRAIKRSFAATQPSSG